MLAQQLRVVNLRLHHVARDLRPAELTRRAAPGANAIGFILWHLVRSQDWAVSTAVRGVPEVVTFEPWRRQPGLATPGIGTGFSPAEADDVAAGVDLGVLLAYADDVHRANLAWLADLREPDLDAVPDLDAHDAPHPAYQTPGFRAEMSSGPEHDDAVGRAGGLPVWVYLTSICVTHAHRHLGEVDLTLGAIRS